MRLVHHGLRVGRHHFFARRAVDDDAARRVRARQVLGHRNCRRHADRPLCAVLVAVKRSLRAAQRVVFENDPERRAPVVLAVLGDECRRQSAGAHFNAEVVLLQVLRELQNRSFFFEADFRVLRDVVRERQEFGVHQRLRPRNHLVARGVVSAEPCHHRRHIE